MRILVTGGAGFVGSAACRHLVADLAYDVVVVDKLTYAGTLSSLDSVSQSHRFSFERADICDPAAISSIFERYRPDAVMHLAAESHVDRSIPGSEVFVKTNVLGTFTMLETARRYLETIDRETAKDFRFIHVSTDEIYGSLGDDGFFSELTRYDPSSPYSATKAASNHLAMAWHRTYGLPVVLSNCSNNYGPHQFPEKLIPLTIINALEGKALPVYGDGLHIRDWLYVEDHVRALVMILKNGRVGETYNIGGHSERNNIDVVHQICALLERFRPATRPYCELITFVPDRPGHDRRYFMSTKKLEQELGWSTLESFESGLEKTVQWYLQRQDWWGPLREGVYAGERLGVLGA